ncbi:MAG: hypothetical protein P4L87_26360 [Formivibrio sp.]|nr:hypothetical protein [Formivibrio sp.]
MDRVEFRPFLLNLRRSRKLFFVIATLSVVATICIYSQLKPQYTAFAVIGPPNTSLANVLAARPASLIDISTPNALRYLLDASSSGPEKNSPYREYLSLFSSARLAKDLAEKHLLPKDVDKELQGTDGPLGYIETEVRELLGFPKKEVSATDRMLAFLKAHLKVASSDSGIIAVLDPMINRSSYPMISFDYGDQKHAVEILRIILHEADQLVRENTRSNISARLVYIDGKLSHVTTTDQKRVITNLLSAEEQFNMIVSADPRYASNVLDVPHADHYRTWPFGLGYYLSIAIVFSVMLWFTIVFFGMSFGTLKFLSRLSDSEIASD